MLSTYCISGTILTLLHVLINLIFTTIIGPAVIPMLEMNQLKDRSFVQGHTVRGITAYALLLPLFNNS